MNRQRKWKKCGLTRLEMFSLPTLSKTFISNSFQAFLRSNASQIIKYVGEKRFQMFSFEMVLLHESPETISPWILTSLRISIYFHMICSSCVRSWCAPGGCFLGIKYNPFRHGKTVNISYFRRYVFFNSVI